MSSDDNTFLEARITFLQTEITSFEAAITAVTSGGVQSYQLDTGQTRTLVTRYNLTEIQRRLESLYNLYRMTYAARYGTNVTRVLPSF